MHCPFCPPHSAPYDNLSPSPSPPPRRRKRALDPATPSPPRPRKRMRASEQASRSERREAHSHSQAGSSRDLLPPISAISTPHEHDDEEGDDYDDDGDTTDREFGSTSVFASGPIGTPAAVPLQKPKRTRQLTTPQQAEVLHALLAQVFFFSFIFFGTNNLSAVHSQSFHPRRRERRSGDK